MRLLMAPRLNIVLVGGTQPVIKLSWLPHWRAYVVRVNGRAVGLVRCSMPLPFRGRVEFA